MGRKKYILRPKSDKELKAERRKRLDDYKKKHPYNRYGGLRLLY